MKSVPLRLSEGSRTLLILLGFNLFAVLLGFPEFFMPISGDTSAFAYCAREINSGSVLYRDLWQFKPPGIYYFFALLFRLFSDSLLTLRLGMVGINFAASLVLYRLGRFYTGKTASLIGTAFFLVATHISGFLNADGPFPETFFPFLGICGFYFWTQYRFYSRGRDLVLAGVFAGLLFTFKQTSISFGSAIFLFLLWSKRKSGIRELFSCLSKFCIGVAAVVVPIIVYFMAVGTWPNYVNGVFFYSSLYPASTPLHRAFYFGIELAHRSIAPFGILWALTCVGVIAVLKPRANHFPKGGFAKELVLWLGIGLIVICLPLRFYQRYLMEILTPCFLLSMIALDRLLEIRKNGAEKTVHRFFLSALGGLMLIGTVLYQAPRTFYSLDDRMFHLFGEPVLIRSELVAAYLDGRKEEGDTIFSWSDARVPYVANIKSAISFIDLNVLPFAQEGSIVSPIDFDQLLEEWCSNPPRYFLDPKSLDSKYPPFFESALSKSAIAPFLKMNYKPVDGLDLAGDILFEYAPVEKDPCGKIPRE